MNAEQYRALVAKLEAIQEADSPEVAADQSASNTAPPAADGTTGGMTSLPAAATVADPNQIPTIEAATFSQAYAQAKKQGLKKFKWCGVYAVKDKQPVKPQPAKTNPGKVDYIGQQDPLGGTLDNPMSFASNSNFGA